MIIQELNHDFLVKFVTNEKIMKILLKEKDKKELKSQEIVMMKEAGKS